MTLYVIVNYPFDFPVLETYEIISEDEKYYRYKGGELCKRYNKFFKKKEEAVDWLKSYYKDKLLKYQKLIFLFKNALKSDESIINFAQTPFLERDYER